MLVFLVLFGQPIQFRCSLASIVTVSSLCADLNLHTPDANFIFKLLNVVSISHLKFLQESIMAYSKKCQTYYFDIFFNLCILSLLTIYK